MSAAAAHARDVIAVVIGGAGDDVNEHISMDFTTDGGTCIHAHLQTASKEESLPPGPCKYSLGKASVAEFNALDQYVECEGLHYKLSYEHGCIYILELHSQ